MRTTNRIRKHPAWVRSVCRFVRGIERARYANRIRYTFVERFDDFVECHPVLSVVSFCCLLYWVREGIRLMFN